MHSRTRSIRSTEAPMDFEFTSRPQTTPAWASSSGEDDPSTPKKRPHDAMTPTPLTPLHNPIFGQNQNIPFIFDTPTRPPAAPYPWAPPASFSPIKAFPSPAPMPEVDMGEASPPKQSVEVSMTSVEGGKDGKGENESEDGIIAPNSMRKVAMGGLRRIFKKRMQEPLPVSKISEDPAEGDAWSESEDEDHNQQLFRTPRRARTSNHYTLNMPAPAPPPSDVPYILLGYLQFFFNLSLILLFLYLAVQFIWTVQRDVEERISEYSLDLVQDIAMCALQHRNNFCDNPIPAVADQCAAWATCMSRDPTIVGRARVGAEMIAEVVNGFVEPISWKTLASDIDSMFAVEFSRMTKPFSVLLP
ncbi:unnamed protein product [Mycena citricolor]|uniref:Brl1/Brr6 domain-containing protein n=1 Tax=Mycena citricolor TaxID=2018698 RepID=A0AAD2HP12_9AGAR|nr:unnamed protein product [Mycena citricolor]CAK5279854.1 unnamed protein product [Mycena citricolor]